MGILQIYFTLSVTVFRFSGIFLKKCKLLLVHMKDVEIYYYSYWNNVLTFKQTVLTKGEFFHEQEIDQENIIVNGCIITGIRDTFSLCCRI